VKEIKVLACIPLSQKKEAEEGFMKTRCPICKNHMWIGPLKVKVLTKLLNSNENYFYGCTDCFEKSDIFKELTEKTTPWEIRYERD